MANSLFSTGYLKAKKEKNLRFYALYDRICRKDVLAAAWTQVKRNGRTCGVDGVRIETIRETPGREEAFLEEIHEQLRTNTYRPQTVKCVMIPKPDGSERSLGIPTPERSGGADCCKVDSGTDLRG